VLDRAGRGRDGGAPPDLFGHQAGGDADDGMADIVPAGQLRDLDPADRVAAELDVLGFDVSQHVISFYEELLTGMGTTRAKRLNESASGETVLVAGVKVATQTPAVRSGQRVIFATLDDATGLVDLAFFESVQARCAARLFGSWLLVVRGTARRSGAGTGTRGSRALRRGPGGNSAAKGSGPPPTAVTVTASECWDLAALEEIRQQGGMAAVRAALEAGDVAPGGAARLAGSHTVVFSNGFAMSRYAETGAPGAPAKHASRNLWHASPGSSGQVDSGSDGGTQVTEVNY
jgi:error-prone DNA polymerase